MLSHIQRSPYLITPKISRWCQSHAPTTGPTALQNLDASFVSLRNERKARLIEQMELELEELEAAAAEDKLMAEKANENNTTAVRAFTRIKPSRKPFPAHLPRERVIVPGPSAASCADSAQKRSG